KQPIELLGDALLRRVDLEGPGCADVVLRESQRSFVEIVGEAREEVELEGEASGRVVRRRRGPDPEELADPCGGEARGGAVGPTAIDADGLHEGAREGAPEGTVGRREG